jgi:hypothetical protein
MVVETDEAAGCGYRKTRSTTHSTRGLLRTAVDAMAVVHPSAGQGYSGAVRAPSLVRVAATE